MLPGRQAAGPPLCTLESTTPSPPHSSPACRPQEREAARGIKRDILAIFRDQQNDDVVTRAETKAEKKEEASDEEAADAEVEELSDDEDSAAAEKEKKKKAEKGGGGLAREMAKMTLD